jgi:hypothetical protein
MNQLATHIPTAAVNQLIGSCVQLSANSIQSKHSLAQELENLAHVQHVVAPHEPIARLFPSESPNPHTFEFRVTAYSQLREWSHALGYSVNYLPGTEEYYFRPFHFQRSHASLQTDAA